MIRLVICMVFLAPTCVFQMPKVLEHPWTVRAGLIFDTKGKEVGVYGVDVMTSTRR